MEGHGTFGKVVSYQRIALAMPQIKQQMPLQGLTRNILET